MSKTGKKKRGVKKEMAEYEKQRLSRIAENKKRMEALGLPKLGTAFTKKIDRKGKQKLGQDHDHDHDEDYEPAQDSSTAEDDDSEEEGDDGDFGSGQDSQSRRRVKNKGSNAKRKASDKKSNNLDDEDDADALQQAIKLSLRDSAENSDALGQGSFENVRSKNVKNQEVRGGMKRKGLFTSRMQMNEDEVIMNFYCFDESWKGSITVSDLKRVAGAHDFIWSDQELRDMIDCFDCDGDGKTGALVCGGGRMARTEEDRDTSFVSLQFSKTIKWRYALYPNHSQTKYEVCLGKHRNFSCWKKKNGKITINDDGGIIYSNQMN